MANTFELIQSATVGSGGAASITFMNTGNIPATYTDLCVKISSRSNRSDTNDFLKISFNGLTTNLSHKALSGDGSTANTGSDASYIYGRLPGNTATSNTFGNAEFYIPNYAGSTAKSVSGDTVMENNATYSVQYMLAGLWNSTSAITSITLAPYYGSFMQYSTAYLYGVKNA